MKNKFQSIYQALTRAINSGVYAPGETLPSENELTEMFQASRETIRKALKMLSEHGYIQKIQGRGSVVLDVARLDFPVSGVASFQELNEKLGLQAKTDVVCFTAAKADETMAKKLEIETGEQVWQVERIRLIDGERIILDKDTFVASLVPGLTKDICAGSIYAYIEKQLGLAISFAKKEIVVEAATEEDEAMLDLDESGRVVVVRSYTYFDNAVPFQYTESRHRADRFRFVDFARRNP